MSPFRSSFIAVAIVAAAALAGCKTQGPPPYEGEGKAVALGPAREVIAAPVGDAVAWLADPAQALERGIAAPDHIYVGTATFGRPGGKPVALGPGTSSGPGGFSFSPDGRWIGALTQWDFRNSRGSLVVGDVETGSVRPVAADTSFFAFSADGAWLAYVSGGTLYLQPAEGGESQRVTTEVATCEFSPDGSALLARKRHLAGGQLVAYGIEDAKLRELGRNVADYRWSPDGERFAYTARAEEGGGYDLFVALAEGAPRKVGSGVTSFLFSPQGEHLAFAGGVSPEKQLGDLFLLIGDAKEPVQVGKDAMDYAFDPTGRRIAWLDGFRTQSRSGNLAWADVRSDAKAKRIAGDVPSYTWSPEGDALAFVQRVFQPIFSIDLFLARLDEDEAVGIAKGVFGYSFTPDGERLLFRTECIRNGRDCTLQSVPVDSPHSEPTSLTRRIYTYHLSPDGKWFLITYMRIQQDALDLAVIPADGSAPPKMIDRLVLPGTQFVGDPPRIAYAVIEQDRLGVYQAEVLPQWLQPPPESAED